MSILTKEHRASMREILDTKSASDDDVFISTWALSEILDTIEALEAERDAIHGIARASHDTRIIGGAHAALREILAVIDGSDEECDQ